MSAFFTGSPWPFAVLVWPLLIGLVPALPRARAHALRVLPLAPLPALVFALLGAPGSATLPDLILGVELAAVPGGALLLAMTAAVWTIAGLHAALTLERTWRAGILSGFWCLTLAGNLGVFLAGDVVTFYAAFAAVSLAAWFLVVHERTEAALSAGRIYITLAVIGEAMLLAGLLIGAQAAGSLLIADVRAILSEAPLGGVALGLLVAGFGIKAGLVPLHVWLPLAHPVAPVPGSAVLSGAIVKAGLIGMVLFLPPGTGWAGVIIAAGFAGAFGAALWGLTQANPKAVLAYSTVSQMGLMLALVGAGQPVAYYALHHGLAKGALFLLVGVLAAAANRRRRRVTLLLALLVAASVAGMPLTGGALAKAAAKADMPALARLAFILSGVTSTMLMAWFIHRLAESDRRAGERSWTVIAPGPALLGLSAMVAPWVLWSGETGRPTVYSLGAGPLLEAGLPVLAGLALAVLVLRRPPPEQPPGDILRLLRPGTGPSWQLGSPPRPAMPHPYRLLRLLVGTRRPEQVLRRWPLAGALLVAGVVLMAGLLTGN